MTWRKLLSFCAMLLLTIVATRAQATSIELQPSTTLLAQGAVVEILIYGIDFIDGTDGGDFMIGWAPNLSFVSLTIQDPPWDLASFDASNASLGYVDYVDVFALFETPGVGGVAFDIATLTLQATDVGAAYVYLGTNLVGWSLAGESIDYFLGSDAQLDIVPVPEPSTAGLLGLSLGWLGWMDRRARVHAAVGNAGAMRKSGP